MRSLALLALLGTVGGCNFGEYDYHDPCANQYDKSGIGPVLPAGDGTFYMRQGRHRDAAPAINVSYLVRFDGNGGEVWRKADRATPTSPTREVVEDGSFVTLTSTSLVTQPLDGSDATTVTFGGACEAREHFADGVILGQSGYFHRPCIFTLGAPAAPLLLGDDSQSTWFLSSRAPDGGWVSWHDHALWRFNAAGATSWRASFAGVAGLPSLIVHTGRGWVVAMDASIESASTVLRVSDDGATVQPLFTTPLHSYVHNGVTETYYEPLGFVFTLGDRVGVVWRPLDAQSRQLIMLDEDGVIRTRTTLAMSVDHVYPVGSGVLLAGGGGLARVDGENVSWQRRHDHATIANVLDDGRYFVVATRQEGSCIQTAKLGLISDAGVAQWWTPELDLH